MLSAYCTAQSNRASSNIDKLESLYIYIYIERERERERRERAKNDDDDDDDDTIKRRGK